MHQKDNMYLIEQKGQCRIDRLLIGVCAAIFPLVPTVYAVHAHIPAAAKFWAIFALVANLPTLFFLLWHSVRAPVRFKAMQEAARNSCNAYIQDMLRIVKDVSEPRAMDAIFGAKGEKVFEGDDGRKYVRGTREQILEALNAAIQSSLDPDTPLVSNTIDVHSRKTADAQRYALLGKLPERWGRLKQVIDYLARYFRYPLLASVLISATVFLVKLIA